MIQATVDARPHALTIDPSKAAAIVGDMQNDFGASKWRVRPPGSTSPRFLEQSGFGAVAERATPRAS